MFLAEPVRNLADVNKDERVSPTEWTAMAERWWGEWDLDKKGTLNEAQLAEGLAKVFPPPPGFGGPGRLPRQP